MAHSINLKISIMTKKEFLKQANEFYYGRFYSIKRVVVKSNKGWTLTYADILSDNAISTEKKINLWSESLEEAYNDIGCFFNLKSEINNNRY